MIKKTKTVYPAWALAYRKPGIELRFIRGKYYLYEYKTVYDKNKKKPKKVTGKFLGSITEQDGLIEPKTRRLEQIIDQKIFKNILCKEYGSSILINNKFDIYCKTLQKTFDNWKQILAIAYCRFVYKCPLKSMQFRLNQSYLPNTLDMDIPNEKQTSLILKNIGTNKEKINSYMKSFIKKGEHILMDTTSLLSNSKIALAKKGYNTEFDPQFNLLYLYSSESQMPIYYRLLPGNIREVKAFKNTVLESGLEKAIIIADKGFYSNDNIKLLQQEKLRFIIPLKRDSALVNYDEIVKNTFKKQKSFFQHENRIIWYRKLKSGLFLFLDEKLRLQEEDDYLKRIDNYEGYTVKNYHQKRHSFGTISILTNLKNQKAIDIYQTYKTRVFIEIMFDGMKNILEADHTYMQDEETLHGWMFINHITLQWYQQLYVELKEKGLLKRYAVNDYINFLTDVKMVQINNSWHLNEVTTQTKKFLEKIKIDLDENLKI